MGEYLHGAYGKVSAVGTKAASQSNGVIVYIGTAPTNTIAEGAAATNVPVSVTSIAEARAFFGYSDDWAKYTLCEAMRVHFETKGVGPLVLINVLDVKKHKADEGFSQEMTPKNGKITVPMAGDVILESVTVGEKVKDTDYTVAYDISKETITISEAKKGGLGAEAVTVSFDKVDPSKVSADDVCGATDGMGGNTGIYAVKDVYQVTGHIPAYIMAPGFSSDPTVHAALIANSRKVNGHWDAFVYSDIPITDKGTPVTPDKAKEWKAANGYTAENEKVFYPLAEGTDGRKYHLSVLAAANFQELLTESNGIPYRSSSNTACGAIKGLYFGEGQPARILDDQTVNEHLNQHGICSAAYVSGRWGIWGAHCADYDQDSADSVNVAETNRTMLYYISNDFQARRSTDVDRPLTANDVAEIVAQEQNRLDALVSVGALAYGKCSQTMTADARSDLMNGDHAFTFDVTTTPLAKSLTAQVNWTDEGFETYFGAAASD